MMKTLASLFLLLLIAPLALCDGQILSAATAGRAYVISLVNLQNQPTAANWNQCFLSACNPGGTNAPTSYTWAAATTPSLSGASIKYSYTTSGTATQTNVLEYWNTNLTCRNCNYYLMDMWVYPVDMSVINSLEFDDALFNAGNSLEYMMGGQCTGGNMNQWNQSTNSWVTGVASCSFPSATWTHFQRLTHISGTNYCYDWVAINGTVTREGQCYPAGALPTGWTDQNLFQVQIDSPNANATPTVYYDRINFQVWR